MYVKNVKKVGMFMSNCNGYNGSYSYSNCNGYTNVTNNNCDKYVDKLNVNYETNKVKPCENIEKIMEELNIEERNFENDKKIREHLFNICCSKHRSKYDYLKEFIKNIFE